VTGAVAGVSSSAASTMSDVVQGVSSSAAAGLSIVVSNSNSAVIGVSSVVSGASSTAVAGVSSAVYGVSDVVSGASSTAMAGVTRTVSGVSSAASTVSSSAAVSISCAVSGVSTVVRGRLGKDSGTASSPPRMITVTAQTTQTASGPSPLDAPGSPLKYVSGSPSKPTPSTAAGWVAGFWPKRQWGQPAGTTNPANPSGPQEPQAIQPFNMAEVHMHELIVRDRTLEFVDKRKGKHHRLTEDTQNNQIEEIPTSELSYKFAQNTFQVVELQHLHQAGTQFSSWSPQASDLLSQLDQIVENTYELRDGSKAQERKAEGLSAESMAALEATVGLLDDELCHLIKAFKAACMAVPKIPVLGDHELRLKQNLKAAYVNELHTIVTRHTSLRKQYEPLLRSTAAATAVGVRRARDMWVAVVAALIGLHHCVCCLMRDHVKIAALEQIQRHLSSHFRELQKASLEIVRTALQEEDTARDSGDDIVTTSMRSSSTNLQACDWYSRLALVEKGANAAISEICIATSSSSSSTSYANVVKTIDRVTSEAFKKCRSRLTAFVSLLKGLPRTKTQRAMRIGGTLEQALTKVELSLIGLLRSLKEQK